MLKHRICLILMLLIVSWFGLYAGKIQKGYDALKVYNYFKAKEIFEHSKKKHGIPSTFGLSIIYSRSDNPFSNIDSANKYIQLCDQRFATTDSLKSKRYRVYNITKPSIYCRMEQVH